MPKLRNTPSLLRFVLLLLLWATPGFGQIVVVVNADNPRHSISKDELKRIFMAERTTWEFNDSKRLAIVLIDRTGSDELAKNFFSRVCKLSHSRTRLKWMEKMLNGQMSELPRQAKTDEQVLEVVQKHRGAIGFVDATVARSQKGTFKILKIDGKLFINDE